MRRLPLPLALALFVAGACPVPSTAPQAPAHDTRADATVPMPEQVRRYTTDRDALERFYWVQQSEERHARMATFEKDWRERLAGLDYDALGVADRVDWHLIENSLDRDAAERELAETRSAEMAPLLSFADAIIALEEARWKVAPIDERAVATQLADLAKEVKAVRARVRRAGGEAGAGEGSHAATGKDGADGKDGAAEEADGAAAPAVAQEGASAPAATAPAEPPLDVDPVLAVRTAKALDELGRVLSTWYDHYAAYRPGFSWWVAEPYGALHDALGDLAKHLRRDVAGVKGEKDDPLIGDPIGREALERAIALELIPYSPEELIAIAEREMAWCEERMKAAAAAMGESDWHAALERVKEDFAPPGEQDAWVEKEAGEALAFLDEKDLVTVEPMCRETWRVQMLDREGQRVLPFAAYGGQKILVAYPTADMDLADKLMALRGNNEHFTRIVVAHELIPGHHLQGYMARRYAEERDEFSTPFLVEGWALYWEMRLWDLGYARGPEDQVGMLFWRMHRCARIIVSLRFHLGQMKPAEMVDFLVEHIGHERENATAEVRRYVGDDYGPLYQCAYMLGGKQLLALHDDLVGKQGWTERAFHDAVLRCGPIPVALIRAQLRETPLPESWQPSWRFAD